MTNHISSVNDIPTRRLSVGRREQKGVALLLTIFGLLLLTAVAAAMMFSSDSETQIAMNYRDSQVAGYAAVAGLQEARDRIHPVFGDLAIAGYLPSDAPDAGTPGAYVLYIINPNPHNNETVASISPWLATVNGQPNPFFDQELCQENMLGLTGYTPGAACASTAIPAGGCSQVGGAGVGWCKYYDNSANATPWNLKDTNGSPIPMDYKWVRITLKQDMNTPVYVPDATTATGTTQVCWDGNYQSQLPAGYQSNCSLPNGSQVIGLNLTSAGSGYTSAPAVTISGGGGSGATAVANMGTTSSGSIATVNLTNPGSGYTAAPTVTFASAPDGSGATFQAVVTGAPITAVSVNNSSSNYCYKTGTTPTLNVTTSPTTDTLLNATTTATMSNNGCIAIVSQTGACNAKAANSSASLAAGDPPGGGSGFAGTATFDSSGNMNSVSITSVGSGYSSGSVNVKISGGKGKNAFTCNVPITFSTGAQVSNVTVSNGGDYMSQPTATLGAPSPNAPSAPTKPTLTPAWSSASSIIKAINIVTPGSGYLQASYSLKITPCKTCSGSGAVATAVPGSTGIISSFTVTNGGGGYASNPNVILSGGGGTGGAATATIAAGGISQPKGQIYMLTSLAITNAGTSTAITSSQGTRSMAQMEAAVRPPFVFNLGGAITLAGPSPNFVSPNSANMTVNGNDANTCNQGKAAAKPAIGVYDDPNNPTNPTSQSDVINALGKPQNYIGAGSAPDVEDVFAAIGGDSVTPSALNTFVQDLEGYVTSPVLTGTVTSLPATTSSSITVVDGDLTLAGNPTGSGILVVTGNMTFSGNFQWNGLVLVIGQGTIVHNGGGNMFINGAMYVAQTVDASGNLLPSVGAPNFTWNGGGTNQVTYDHCLADNLLRPYEGKPSNYPLQVLSTRMLNF